MAENEQVKMVCPNCGNEKYFYKEQYMIFDNIGRLVDYHDLSGVVSRDFKCIHCDTVL